MRKLKNSKVFVFNPETNGGESLLLKTLLWDNGDTEYMTHQIIMNCYGNNATFDLEDVQITPEKLRRAADQIEEMLKR
jgi:hypothetical protein